MWITSAEVLIWRFVLHQGLVLIIYERKKLPVEVITSIIFFLLQNIAYTCSILNFFG